MVEAPVPFSTRLGEASRRSLLCLGLDPADAQTAADAESHCLRLLDATLEQLCAVKPNVAFFERLGSAGLAVLEELRQRIPREVIWLVDAKRGDIGSTGEAYATALYDVLGADAVTVNPLMGEDSVRPFLRPGKGVFLLARTSNPGAADFLEQRGAAGTPLYAEIVTRSQRWPGAEGIGYVVGATAAAAVAEVRAAAPHAPLLVPGIGAQGGDLDATVRAGLDQARAGLVVPLSRGIAQAADPGAAARELRERIEAIRAAA